MGHNTNIRWGDFPQNKNIKKKGGISTCSGKSISKALDAAREQQNNLLMVNEIVNSGMWMMHFDDRGEISRVTWSDQFRHMIGFEWFHTVGKGFAVVANEVRNLSISTTDTSKLIAENLQNMSDSVNSVIERIVSINDNVIKESTDMQEINATIEELTALSEEIKEISENLFSAG